MLTVAFPKGLAQSKTIGGLSQWYSLCGTLFIQKLYYYCGTVSYKNYDIVSVV